MDQRTCIRNFHPLRDSTWALWLGALFVWTVSGVWTPVWTASPEFVRVEYVIDGDTVVLDDGRKVRLIGINAPEKQSKNRQAEPFSLEARLALEETVAGRNLLLEHGIEPRDRYGRHLAWLSLEDGTDIQEMMLMRGYAAYVAIAPNTLRTGQYRRAEQSARNLKTGIWSLSNYPITDQAQADAFEGGFSLVRSKVTRINRTERNYYMNLENGMSVRISRTDYATHWEHKTPEDYLRAEVEVRGWFHRQKYGLVTTVNHPSSIVIVNR